MTKKETLRLKVGDTVYHVDGRAGTVKETVEIWADRPRDFKVKISIDGKAANISHTTAKVWSLKPQPGW